MEGSPRAPSLGGESDGEYALWDAAYVLGSLPEPDRRAYEAHLGGCRSCRQSVDQLSGMPALLGQLTVDEVAAIDDRVPDALPPLSPRVLPSLLAKVWRRRRKGSLGHGDDDRLRLGNPNRHEMHLPGETGQLRPRR